MNNLGLWEKKEYTGMTPGLKRIRAFLNALGNPEKKFACVHIAGTNGKGSTARMIAKILESAGYKTGLYTSPHLIKINERIQVDSCLISNSVLGSLAGKYTKTAEKHQLSFFEFITALAFIYFARKKVDIAVLETGLGGRFDATNVVERPAVSIITDVDFDHEAILGNNIAKIAYEKAGIIKPGCAVICGAERVAAQRVVSRISDIKRCKLLKIHKDFRYNSIKSEWDDSLQIIVYVVGRNRFRYKLSLMGEHQAKNAACSLAAIDALRGQGFVIENTAVSAALKNVSWPGRFDMRRYRGTTVVLDGAHNPAGAERFAKTWKQSRWGQKKQTFIFGVLRDKKFKNIVKALAPLVGRLIIVPVQSPRNLDPQILRNEWERYLDADKIEIADSVKKALAEINEDVVAVTGSLYLIGETLNTIATKNRD